MRILIVLISFCFFFPVLAGAEIIPVKNIFAETYRLKAWNKSDEKANWQSIVTVSVVSAEGKSIVYNREEGEGIYGKSKDCLYWEAESVFFWENERLIPYQAYLVYRNDQGEIKRSVKKLFDLERQLAICEINGSIKKYDFADDLVDREMLGLVLANFPFEEKQELNFHLLSHEPSLYKVAVINRGRDNLNVAEKIIECYKLELIPDLGALSFLNAFVPKTYFWYTISLPHRLVRYEGLESGLGSPHIIMEISLKTDDE